MILGCNLSHPHRNCEQFIALKGAFVDKKLPTPPQLYSVDVAPSTDDPPAEVLQCDPEEIHDAITATLT